MAQESPSPSYKLASRRTLGPVPPNPKRSTSKLSVVSVSAHQDDGPRKLLSQPVKRTSSDTNASYNSQGLSKEALPGSPRQTSRDAPVGHTSNLTPHDVETIVDVEGSSQKTSASLSSSRSSRKGKERISDDSGLVGEVDEGQVQGEMVRAAKGGEAAIGLRELVRRTTGRDGISASRSESSRTALIRGMPYGRSRAHGRRL
jgi:hypothetical protein